MHIPNGYLSDPICAATTLAAAAGYGAGLWQARRAISTGSCRSLALAGAAIFAAQMINFPVDHGTSGHLVGAAAAAILLGPWAATLVMGVVLAAQAVLFGDGACATWGANMLTMGIAAPWTAWAVASALQRLRPTAPKFALAAVAGFVSVLAAASVCALELAASGSAALSEVLPAMLQTHLLVAASEGLLTAGLVALVARRTRGASLADSSPRRAWFESLAACAAAVLLVAPWASAAPDGLESVAGRLGFAAAAADGLALLAPDYQLPGLGGSPLAIGLAGLAGVAIVLAGSYGVGRAATCRIADR